MYEVFIESGNIEVIEVEEGGVVCLLRWGEVLVFVCYEGVYVVMILIVMGDCFGFVW